MLEDLQRSGSGAVGCSDVCFNVPSSTRFFSDGPAGFHRWCCGGPDRRAACRARATGGANLSDWASESIPAAQNAANLDALRKGLRDLGYVEGRDLIIEYRSAEGRADQFPDLAAELVRLKVDLIVTRGTPAAMAAKDATGTIPLLMATMGDPRAIVTSFARAGGNITGVTTFSTELTAKRIELIKEMVPNLSRVGLLHNVGNPAAPPEWEETMRAARALGLHAELLDVRSQEDLSRAFELAVRRHVDALIIGPDGLTQMHQQTILEMVARNRLPAAWPAREYVEAGIGCLRGELFRPLFPARKLHRQDLQGREAQ